jgi:predicted  nucleic acid-binding Zn-ribbon protein
LFILIFTMVTAVTHPCDCSKCGQWRHAQIHGGAIVKRQEQWEANPRFYACEYIIGDIHNEESYARTNNNNMYPGVGHTEVSSPQSSANNNMAPPPPMRPVRGCKRVAVAHDVDLSSSEEDDELTAPPSIRSNARITYKVLQQDQRRLKDRHEKTLATLESLKCDHQATVNELRSLKSKLQSLDNKLELDRVKIKLATTSGQLVCLTQKYENAELNYQQTADRLASSLTELKDELDAHLGTKQELADAAAGLIVARSAVLDAAIDIDEARKEVFETSAELLSANDDIAILEGLYRRRDFQETMEAEANAGRSLFQKLNSWANGTGKWKRIAQELFRIQVLRPHIIEHSVTHIRDNTYTAKSMARVMDLHHGFNLSGLDAFRLVEPNYMGEKRLLWSSSSVKRVFRKIEIEMKDEISFKVIRDRNGKGQIVDGIRFDTKQLFTYLVHHFGLSEEAKVRQVEIALTVDGAPLDDKIGHVTIGFKICDKAARCPITKVLIFNEEKEGPNLQSGKFCFPVAMLLAKDNKETYNKYLREIFNDVQVLRSEGIPELGWLPFDIPEPQDMKSFQLCLGRGGACKGTNYFCHLCQLHSDSVQLPNQIACRKCASASHVTPPTTHTHIPTTYEQPPPTLPNVLPLPPVTPIPATVPIPVTPPVLPKKCYCHIMCTEVACATAETQLRALQANPEIQQLWETAQRTNAKRGKSQWEMLYNKCSIHLVEDGVAIIIDNPSGLGFPAYQQAVLKTLNTLGLGQKYARAEFPEQVEVLRSHLALVCRMMALTDVARFKHSVSTAMMKIENAVPCILHLHKRLMEKILSLIMLKSLAEQEKHKSARLRHAEKMSKILNENAFGCANDPGTYSVPMDEKTGELGEVKFNDGYAKDVEKVLSSILPKLLTKPESNCSQWKICFDGISEIMITLRQRQDFTHEEISDLDKKITLWSSAWISLTGREGMTNYIHMICSGHLVEYLKRWKNLYRFSNQGWEYQNASIRYIYHHRSQHGGSSGKNGTRSSKVRPLGMWFLRKLWWMTKDTSVLKPCLINGERMV